MRLQSMNSYMVVIVVAVAATLMSCSSTEQQGDELKEIEENFKEGGFDEGEIGALNESGESAANEGNYGDNQEYAQDYNNTNNTNAASTEENGYGGNEYGDNYGNSAEGGGDNYGATPANAAVDTGSNYGADYGSNLVGGNQVVDEFFAPDAADVNSAVPTDDYGATTSDVSEESFPTSGQSANEVPMSDAAVAAVDAPKAGGLVKYFMNRTSIHDAPGGAVVGTYEQGNHAVVWDENGWSRMHTGTFVESSGMSERAVSRPRESGGWR